MTERQFAWTALLLLMLGGLISYALFSTPQLVRTLFFNNGSLADWLAAAGTWVIGLGAWSYARAGHEHNVREALAAEHRELKSALSDFNFLIAFAARVNSPHATFEQFDNDGVDWNTRLPAFVKTTKRILASLDWNAPRLERLNNDAMTQFVLAEVEAQKFLALADEVLPLLLADEVPGEELVSLTEFFSGAAAYMATHIGAVTKAVKRERKLVHERLARLDLMLHSSSE